MEDRKDHWENIYGHKQPNEVSWTQEIPQTSINFIKGFNLSKTAKIIDIGGGDSKLVDFLIEDGYQNITVLDISEKALDRAKTRLQDKADQVTWVVSDVLDFEPDTKYDVWHDRAAFHFLTSQEQISTYLSIAANSVSENMVIGTFSENGPLKCSGLPIKQYSETELEKTLAKDFTKLGCIREDHTTPFGTRQNFLFCSFQSNHI